MSLPQLITSLPMFRGSFCDLEVSGDMLVASGLKSSLGPLGSYEFFIDPALQLMDLRMNRRLGMSL